MKKLSKVLLFLVLAITALSLTAFSVFAEDTTGEETTVPEGAAIEFTAEDGTITYYTADEFANAFSAAGTVKLLSDIETDCGTIEISNDMTLDLNGYNLKRAYYYGNFYIATDNGDSTYTYGTDSTYQDATAEGLGRSLFSITAKINFDITSSSGGGNIYNANVCADTWYCNDKIVKRDCTNYGRSWLVYIPSGSDCSSTITLNGGISLYTESVIYQEESASEYTYNVSIDDVFVYTVKNTIGKTNYTFYFGCSGNLDVSVTDTLIYHNVNTALIRLLTATAEGYTASVIFENCDIIKDNATYSASITTAKTADELIFENCRLYDVGSSSTVAYTTNGTLDYYYYVSGGNKNASNIPCRSDYERKEVSVTKSYTVPTVTSFQTVTSGDMSAPSFDFSTKSLSLTYNRITTKSVTVNWSVEGKIIKTETLYPGIDSVTAPEVDPYEWTEDDYRNIVYQWADAAENGNAIPDTPGWEDSYTYYAVKELNGVTNYVAGLKGAQLAYSYYGQLWELIYLPKKEGMEIPSVSGVSSSSETGKLIDGKEYYLYTTYRSTTNTLNTSTRTVKYTIDGQAFSAKINVSGLIYAELVFEYDGYEAERESVANFLRYIREGYEGYSGTDAAVATNLETYRERLQAIIGTPSELGDGSTSGGKYDLPAYTTKFDVPDSNIYDYADYIHSISYGMVGSSARIRITLTESATKAGVTVTKIYTNGISPGLKSTTTTITDAEGNTATVNLYYDNNQRVYDVIGVAKITLSIPEHTDSETGEIIPESTKTVTYSMAEYISAMLEESRGDEIEIARAMYDFGVAAKKYRDNLINY